MKVCIITLHNVKNYGSVLQTYATQKTFEKFGCQVEFVDYWRNSDRHLFLANLVGSKIWNQNLITRLIYFGIKFPDILKQKLVFHRFVKKRIYLSTHRYDSFESLQKNPPDADIYCTGSDQVWNSDYNEGIDRAFFLDFAPNDAKRISYAASVGKNDPGKKETEMLKVLFMKYARISVREKHTADFINKLGFPGSVSILDPTLQLDASDWNHLIAPRIIKQRYLLVYHLNDDDLFEQFAIQLAKELELKLVRICYKYKFAILPGKLVWCPAVEKFLSLFYYADYIFTDSFHGTAFSINFNKQFAVSYPSRFSGRLVNILRLTGLENRAVTNSRDFAQVSQTIDYRSVNRILRRERNKADDFLTEALKR